MAEQLWLRFPYQPHFTFAAFLPTAANRRALAFLDAAEWPQHRLALWGAPGCGKTHLLHAWSARHGAVVLDGASLHEPHWPEGPVALDRLEAAPSETALLHLLNAADEAGHKLLLASRLPPARLPATLPDLASRLRATTAVEIGGADDAFLALLLARLAGECRLPITPALQSWLLTRLPRSPAAIRDAVTRLDEAALSAGTALTRPLAARALAGMFCDDLVTETTEASPGHPGVG